MLKLNKDLLLISFFRFIFIVFFSISFITKEGKAQNLKFLIFKEDKAETIFLFPSQISLLSFPCSITKVLLGSPNDIKAEIDKLNKTDIHILLKKWTSKPSNLIVKCDNKVFLFNLIPSKNRHYDYVKVLRHISSKPFRVKSDILQSSFISSKQIKELKSKYFKIKKILDFSLGKKLEAEK